MDWKKILGWFLGVLDIRWSPQTIIQKLCALRNWQDVLRRNPQDQDALQEQPALQELLVKHISWWGGMRGVERRLRKLEPRLFRHGNNPFEIESMVWDWLPEEYRL